MHTIYNPKRYVEVDPVGAWDKLPSWFFSEKTLALAVRITASTAVICQIIAILANSVEFAFCQSLHTGEGIEIIQFLNAVSIFGAVGVCVGIHFFKREATRGAFFAFCVANSISAFLLTASAYVLLSAYAMELICR